VIAFFVGIGIFCLARVSATGRPDGSGTSRQMEDRSMHAAYVAVLLLLLLAGCANIEPETPVSELPSVALQPGTPPPAATPAAPPPTTKAAPPVAKTPAVPPALDLNTLETQLRETKAIGIFTKITLKNQVDDLLDKFGAGMEGRGLLTASAFGTAFGPEDKQRSVHCRRVVRNGSMPRHRSRIRGDQLLMKGKDLRVGPIDRNPNPMDMRLAEGLDAREVLDEESVGRIEGLINAEDVRVADRQHDRSCKGARLVYQYRVDPLQTGLRVKAAFAEQPGDFGQAPDHPWIGLSCDEHRRTGAFASYGERGPDPFDRGVHAVLLGCCVGRLAGNGDQMNGGVHDRSAKPEHVLDEVLETRLRRLSSDRHEPATGRAGRLGEEERAKEAQALVLIGHRRGAAGAVEPVVVPRRVNERKGEPLKEIKAAPEQLIGAGFASLLDVTNVNDPLQLGPLVDVVDKGLKERHPIGSVRSVANQSELIDARGRVEASRQEHSGQSRERKQPGWDTWLADQREHVAEPAP